MNYLWILAASVPFIFAMAASVNAGEVPKGSILRAVSQSSGLEGRVMWMDATANLKKLSTREGVKDVVAKCRKANINTIVVDVKPLVGEVLYKSYVAPKLRQWKNEPYPEDYDLLQTMIEEAHAVGIPVYAAINVFAEGHRDLGVGPGFARKDWQAVVYTAKRSAVTEAGERFPVAENANENPRNNAIVVWTKTVPTGKAGELNVVVSDGKVTSVFEGDQIGASGLGVTEGVLVLKGVGESREWLLKNAPVGASVRLEASPLLKPITETDTPGWAVFVNPIHPEARAYELSLVRELYELYDIDGIALDRMRYANLYTDFSDLSRRKFERWLAQPVENWPQDIFTINPVPGKDVIPGKLYKEWLEWRAFNIREFLADAEAARRVIRPHARIAVYAGSWYASYYSEGVNWASEDYNAGFSWMTPTYHTTGYAKLLDYLMVGAYYKLATREEAIAAGRSPGATVEGATEGAVHVVNDATWVYGSLYLLDYKDDPDAFERAVKAAVNAGSGVMLFDLVYVEQYDWWPILERLFAIPAKAPHDVEGLRETLGQARELIRKDR